MILMTQTCDDNVFVGVLWAMANWVPKDPGSRPWRAAKEQWAGQTDAARSSGPVPVPCDWCSPPGLCPAQVRMGKGESRSVVSWGLAVWSSECRVRYFIELLPNWVFFPCPHFLLLWFCSSWCCCILRVRVYGLIFMCIFLRDFVCGKETTYK